MSTTPEAPRQKTRPLRDLLLVVLVLLLAGGGVGAYLYCSAWSSVTRMNLPRSIRAAVVNPDKLDAAFTDADGDLVADPPKDPAKQLDPAVLRFSPLEHDRKRAARVWKEFTDHLASSTGKKVEIVTGAASGHHTADQLRRGELHIAALSTGSVPLAVNRGGFVPCCVMADDDGQFAYQVEILVPAKSDVKTLADLKGKTITLTSMSSLSSFKAPLVLLWQKEKLLPGRDYEFQISTGQEASVRGVCDGQFEAVAVANDLLRRVVAREQLSPDDYRSLYKSDSYPPACFGHAHNLKPDLAEKVRKAFLSFDWKGTGLEKAYRPANQTRFVPISYKKDWESVRAVDRAMRELVEQRS